MKKKEQYLLDVPSYADKKARKTARHCRTPMKSNIASIGSYLWLFPSRLPANRLLVEALLQCLSIGCIVHPRVYQNFPEVYQLDGVHRGVPDVCSSRTVKLLSTYVLCSSKMYQLLRF